MLWGVSVLPSLLKNSGKTCKTSIYRLSRCEQLGGGTCFLHHLLLY